MKAHSGISTAFLLFLWIATVAGFRTVAGSNRRQNPLDSVKTPRNRPLINRFSEHQRKRTNLQAAQQEDGGQEGLQSGGSTTGTSSSHDAVVVGGGPAGLATALTLARRGWGKVLVLERRPSADAYEPSLGFTYNIDGRGQKFMKEFGLMEKLKQSGVASDEIFVNRLNPDGSCVETKFPVIDPNAETRYWIPRRAFLRILYDEVVDNWSEQIQVLFDSQVTGFEFVEETKEILVKAKVPGAGAPAVAFRPRLVVAADGLQSPTREALSVWAQEGKLSSLDVGGGPGGTDPYEMKITRSAAAGLQYKVLTLPPRFQLGKNASALAEPEKIYAITPAVNDPKISIRLGCLPAKEPNEPRPANIIARANHPVWGIKDADEFLAFLKENFPQVDVPALVSKDQALSFVNTRPGRFCEPQFCPTLAAAAGQEGAAAVVIVGDAAHAFPPDLGQGVNSALEDVVALGQALDGAGGGATARQLVTAAAEYQRARAPEAEALCRLMTLGGPYQYRQSKVGLALWGLNVAFRRALNALLPRIFSPQIFMMVSNPQLSYTQVLAKANRTTKRIWLLFTLFSSLLILLVPR